MLYNLIPQGFHFYFIFNLFLLCLVPCIQKYCSEVSSMEKIQNMQSNISEFIYWLFVIAQMASVFFNNKYENNNPLTSLW